MAHADRRCNRCGQDEAFEESERCSNCSVHEDRVVRRRPLRTRTGGKRGRNSGTTNKAKQK